MRTCFLDLFVRAIKIGFTTRNLQRQSTNFLIKSKIFDNELFKSESSLALRFLFYSCYNKHFLDMHKMYVSYWNVLDT